MRTCLLAFAMLLAALALPAAAQVIEAVVVEEAIETVRADTVAAEDTAEPADDITPADPVPVAKPPKLGTLHFHLMDGTIITGKLTTKALPISTEFGELTVPMDAITSFSPGLSSHPTIAQRIDKLIQQLASPEVKTRDKAQSQLLGYGVDILPELQRHTRDADAERRVRIATITEELIEAETDEFNQKQGPSVSLVRLDQVVTQEFTIAGKIKQETFTIASKFGELNVKLQDIKRVERLGGSKPEVRRTVEITGMNMTCQAYKATGIRVNRGDRIIIRAEGSINMRPWGSRTFSGPDGTPQNGMYKDKIPMGALAGRIGDSGEEFLVGSKSSFVAKKTGVLHLGFAMQQNWANNQFPGTYKARVRVVPAQ